MTYHSGNNLIDPHLLFEKSHLQTGMHVADLGCGRTGHIVFPAAKFLGETGLVYAVDIMKDVLENIKKRASLENFQNVQTVWANLESQGKTAIPNKNLDVGFLISMLFQSDNMPAVLNEVKRMLKDKARLVVVDWSKKGLPFAPPEERMIDFEKVKNWGLQNGFAIQDEFDMGPYHHGVVLYRHD